MKYYKEENAAGIVTGVLQTGGTPENSDNYTYTEITESEYDILLSQMTPPQPVTEPSLEERNRADIDFIALMMGVDLG